MSKTNLIITVAVAPRRNTVVQNQIDSGRMPRAKSWSKNGRFAGPRAERRAAKAALRSTDW